MPPRFHSLGAALHGLDILSDAGRVSQTGSRRPLVQSLACGLFHLPAACLSPACRQAGQAGQAGRPAVSAELHAKRFYVSGYVQGVGYRYFALRAANRLGVSGYVRNLRDGRVEVYAIGAPARLAELRAELRRGPYGVDIDEVTEDAAEVIPGYSRGFAIERTE
jgi:acylphosphatase